MTKNCNIISDLLPLYIDGTCSDETKMLVEEHLKTCKKCKKELEDLKFNIETSKTKELNGFKKFAKKINFKIIRNTIISTTIIIGVIIGIVFIYGNQKYTMKYTDKLDIELLGKKNDWNFVITSPIDGYAYAKSIKVKENGENVNLVFVTWKYSLQEYFDGSKASVGPDLNYKDINLDEKIRVYYTTTDLKKVKNASQEEINKIIKDSNLIFTNEKVTTEMNCTLNNRNYSYRLTYFKENKQIISSDGDTSMPNALLIDIISKENYKSLWFPGDRTTEIFKKTEEFMKNKGGTCTKKDIN